MRAISGPAAPFGAGTKSCVVTAILFGGRTTEAVRHAAAGPAVKETCNDRPAAEQ